MTPPGPTDPDPEEPEEKVTLKIPDRTQELLGKKVSELVGDDIAIAEDGTVTGTIHYVYNYNDFSDVATERKGNYMPVQLEGEGETVTVTKNSGTPKTVDFEPLWVLRVGKEDTFKFEVDGEEIGTLKFGQTTFEKSNVATDPEIPEGPQNKKPGSSTMSETTQPAEKQSETMTESGKVTADTQPVKDQVDSGTATTQPVKDQLSTEGVTDNKDVVDAGASS